MAFDEEAALKYLEGSVDEQEPDTAAVEQFLKKETQEPEPIEPVQSESMLKPLTDYATGMNDQFLDLLGLPGDAFDWAAEKLGSNLRVGGSAELRELGKKIGMGTHTPGEEPDTGSYKAGEYTATGLEFLAPFLQWTKVAKMTAAGAQGTGLAMQATPSMKGTSKLVAERMTAPFVSAPKTAYLAEIASGTMAGYGAYYGGEEFGPTGEMVGGILGGLAPIPLVFNASKLRDYVLKSYLPYTEAGGKARAAGIIRELAEDPNIRGVVEENMKKALPGTRITSGKLTRDPHLMALEKAIVNEDPALARELRIQDAINNHIARRELTKLSGDEVIEEAQKILSSKYLQLQSRLNARVDLALNKVQKATQPMTSTQSRKAINIAVKSQIDNALKDARTSEGELWNLVNKRAMSDTSETKTAFRSMLQERFREDDPTEIPKFLYEFLGKLDNSGVLVGGKYKATEPVGGLHALRSRLLKEIRVEKAGEVPDWNKVRILENMEEAMLNDLSKSGAGKELDDAIRFSRELNKKFKGDIMSTIMRHNKAGGVLAPELTMEGIGTGPKGAVHIKRILAASPESKGNIEEVLKMDLAQSKVIKDDRINLTKAKDYVLHNEDILEIFPNLKSDMNRAIALEEQAQWFEKTAVARMKKASQSLSAKLAEAKPDTVLNTIIKSKYPEKEMQRQLRRLNAKGVEGIKNDIVDTIIAKSKTTDIGPDGIHLLSGKKARGYWNENKSILSKPFNKEELRRIDQIVETLRLGDDMTDLPMHTASESLKPRRTILAYVTEVAAARIGAMFGSGTSGASLKTASQGANTARRIMGQLDVGTAKKFLKDAIQDKELFLALSEDMTKLTPDSKALRIIQSWMVAHSINSLEMQEE